MYDGSSMISRIGVYACIIQVRSIIGIKIVYLCITFSYSSREDVYYDKL